MSAGKCGSIPYIQLGRDGTVVGGGGTQDYPALTISEMRTLSFEEIVELFETQGLTSGLRIEFEQVAEEEE